MKVNSLSFPYPLLGSNDDIAGSYKIDGPHISHTPEKIRLTLSHILRNHDIQHYLDIESAEFMVEISCGKTFFRKSYFSSSAEQMIEIPQNLLRDQVEVDFYVIARRNIDDYLPQTAHSDYCGYKFALKKGDVLAYAGKTKFSASKQWLASDAIGNFMEIIDGKFKSGPMKIDLMSEKISIRLSTPDFDKYHSVRSSSRFDHVFHSAVGLPALLFAISQFIEAPEQFDGLSWTSVLNDKRQNGPRANEINWEKENAPEIAQLILDNPFKRTLDALEQMVTDYND